MSCGESIEAFLAPLERHINAMGAPNKATAHRGAKAVVKAVFPPTPPPPSAVPTLATRLTAFASTLAPPLIALADGPSEANRSLALAALTALFAATADAGAGAAGAGAGAAPAPAEAAPTTAAATAAAATATSATAAAARRATETALALLLPILVRRYVRPAAAAAASGAAYAPVEEAEEVRAEVAGVVTQAIAALAPAGLLPLFAEDLFDVVLALLADDFHEVMTGGAEALTLLAAHAASVVKMRTAQPVYNAVLALFAHQHSRVRVAAIHALEALIICVDTGLTVELVKDLCPSLTTLVLDRTPKVRAAAAAMLGSWLTLLVDRHVYMRYLLPILLIGLTDDLPPVAAAALTLVESVAADASAAEAEELAQLGAFGDDVVVDPAATPAAFGGIRPSLAARRLVGRKMHDMLPTVLADMADWTIKRRHVAARLLAVLLVFGERGMATFVPDIVNAFLAVAVDEDALVRAALDDAARLLGAIVDPPALVLPLLDIIVDAQGVRSVVARAAAIHVLARVLEGVPPPTLAAAAAADGGPLTAALLATLAHAPTFDVQDAAIHLGLTAVASVLVSTALLPDTVIDSAFLLLKILLAQLAWATTPELAHATEAALDALVTRLDAASRPALIAAHAPALLAPLAAAPGDVGKWTPVSTSLVFTGLVVAAATDTAALSSLVALPPAPLAAIVAATAAKGSTETLTLLFGHIAAAAEAVAPSSSAVDDETSDGWVAWLTHAVLPAFVWRAGLPPAEQRAEATRVAAAVLAAGLVSAASAAELVPALFAPLPSLLDDRLTTTRSHSVAMAAAALGLIVPLAPWEGEVGAAVAGAADALLSRLNDAEDAIRIAVATPLAVIAAYPPDAWTLEQRTAALSSLFIHLDDPAPPVRAAMLTILTPARTMVPEPVFAEALAAASSAATNASVELAALSS